MSYSAGVNQNLPSEFTYENLAEKPIIIDPSGLTAASFDWLLADDLWYGVEGAPGKVISIYVDTNEIIGNEEVAKKEFKHIKSQFKTVEAAIDPVTGNAFDLKVTKAEKFAETTDIRVYKVEDMKKDYGEDSTGNWDSGDLDLVYQDEQGGYSEKSNKDLIKETLSHEIGHIFGLDHPVDSLESRDYFPNTIMNCCEGFTDTILTNGDLGLLAYGWLHTFPFISNQV